MLKVILFLIIALAATALQNNELMASENRRHQPQKVIVDTDLDSDVDDVGALSMLLNLHKAGTIRLIGIIVTSDDPFAPVCAGAITTYHGFPGIPVGFLKNQPVLTNHSRYTKFIASEFPASLHSREEAEEAITLYRRLLAQSSEESVVILTIGHLSSLKGLLQSEPDQISPLNGEKLAETKVKKWICMGGQFPKGKEANFYRPDPLSTCYCVDHWKKEVIFCGWEIGNKVITGDSVLRNRLTANNPLYRAYELYNKFSGRPCWDQIAVMQLIDHPEKLFSYIKGRCIVTSDGSNTWEDLVSGKHQYVIQNPSINNNDLGKDIDNLMIGTERPAKKKLTK